jgi:hypothetical protein
MFIVFDLCLVLRSRSLFMITDKTFSYLICLIYIRYKSILKKGNNNEILIN